MAFKESHGEPLLKFLYHVITVILRRLDITFYALVLQSSQVLHEPFYLLLELIIFLGNEVIT
jgi:hypothetical protein